MSKVKMAMGLPKAHQFLGEKVMPLHALCNGLVWEMQEVIKAQDALLEEAARAIDYLLRRSNQNHEKLRNVLDATEADARLTAVVAKITGRQRKDVCKVYGCFYVANDEEEVA